MPYKIRKRGSGWVKVDRRGRVVSRHKTKAKAKASIAAYYANRKKR